VRLGVKQLDDFSEIRSLLHSRVEAMPVARIRVATSPRALAALSALFGTSKV
jgi:hypothetical protein